MTIRRIVRFTGCLLLGCIIPAGAVRAGSMEDSMSDDYLKAVQAYADTLLNECRDVYGDATSPLFATTLDRKTLRLFEGDKLEEIRSIPREGWDIRPNDRMVTGANPMHHENFYQILYALSEVTGNKRYSEEADKTLKWFFEHCQSETTGLFAWGEHIGWDFLEEQAKGRPHEFFRPWVLWGKSYELAPEPCATFARGVWEHQIADHETGQFSRHTNYWEHGPGTGYEFPRHGGFYIATWAAGYKHTQDPVFLEAIGTMLDYFDGHRSPQSDAIPCESAERSDGNLLWPASNLSLAVDNWNSAGMVPRELGERMRQSASRTDKVFLRIAHDLTPEGKGFAADCNTHTLEVLDYSKGIWGAGYGGGGDAAFANLCMLRYRQTGLEGYKKLILQTGERYCGTSPNPSEVLHPGPLGDAITLMLSCYELSGDAKYLNEAQRFADFSIKTFLSDGSPLPPATTQHSHYEAITRGDTLMMALLELSLARNEDAPKVSLVYTDR